MNGLDLRDIHLPAGTPWWPPAPGWWLLLMLAAILAALLLWWRRRLRRPPLVRLSLREFQRIREAYDAGRADRGGAIDDVARLLRRILIGYRGRAQAAASTGDAWLEQFERLVPRHGFSAQQLQLLARGRYRADADCDVDALLEACETTIRSLPKEQRHAAD